MSVRALAVLVTIIVAYIFGVTAMAVYLHPAFAAAGIVAFVIVCVSVSVSEEADDE